MATDLADVPAAEREATKLIYELAELLNIDAHTAQRIVLRFRGELVGRPWPKGQKLAI